MVDVVDIEMVSLADDNSDVLVSASSFAESELLPVDIPVFKVEVTEALDMDVVLSTVDVDAVSLAGSDIAVIDGAVVAVKPEALEVKAVSF